MDDGRQPKLWARVPPDLRDWVATEAERRFGERERYRSKVIRDCLLTERRLRQRLGPQYDAIIGGLLGREPDREDAA